VVIRVMNIPRTATPTSPVIHFVPAGRLFINRIVADIDIRMPKISDSIAIIPVASFILFRTLNSDKTI